MESRKHDGAEAGKCEEAKMPFRRTRERQGIHLTRSAIRVTSVSAEPALGMGFGDRFGDFRGGSGSFKGRVQQADKPGEIQGKRASKRRSHIT
jgi:hypothetical protein